MDKSLEVPSYISSRSANSLISFSRPTRIQAITLEALNRILDELLYLILSSAKSLATDRIKTDGILKVLGGQSGSGSGAGALLAKNAVLEAELELRSYLDGQRKEGGKMPFGLSATSRWDGTDGFPVQSAYKALRIRCQYYSTLGELEDPSPNSPQEQNIMSSDGRPIATITPGVAIYVTALLEFVAEYILQNVARVIERDNSDEATLNDLTKAMEEDEGTSFWWKKMQSKKYIQTLDKENGTSRGKVQKPWQVPDADEYDQAAGKKKFNRQSVTSIPPSHSSSSNVLNNTAVNSKPAGAHDRTSSSGHHDVRNGATNSSVSSHQTNTTGMTSIPSGSTESGTLKRRTSFDKSSWFGKRRGSFRSSQDLGMMAGLGVSTPGVNVRDSNPFNNQTGDDSMNNGEGGDFDSLVMSGQTMKVSLTPNRLRSMDAAADNSQESDKAKRSARKRPGTGNLLLRADTTANKATSPTEGQPQQQQEDQSPRPGSRAGSIIRPSSSRGGHVKAAPPSAYRGPEGENRGTPDHLENAAAIEDQEANNRNKPLPAAHNNHATPPSPMTDGSFAQPSVSNGRESRMSLVSQVSTDTTNKRMTLSGAGGKVLSLFGRKSTSTASISPSTSANVSVDPLLQRSHTSSTYRSAKGTPRINGEENHNDSRSTTPFVAPDGGRMENRDSVSTASIVVSPTTMERESSMDAVTGARSSISPSLQRVNGKDYMHNVQEEERRESSVGHDDIIPNKEDPTHGNQNGSAQTPTSGMVGLYSDPKANASASTLSSVTNRDPNSRKVVPWSYNRRRSSGPLMNAANRVGSGGSSHGHGDAPPPPSAWSQNNFETTGSGSSGHGNTPTIGVSPTFASSNGRTSPSPRPFSMSSKTDTARLLVQLNQRMRECNNVEECQRLVMQALALTAAAVHNENDPTSPTTTNIPSQSAAETETTQVQPVLGKEVTQQPSKVELVPQYRPLRYRNLALPMAIGYDPTEDDNLPMFHKQGVVASWLLDNEGEEPEMEITEPIKSSIEKSVSTVPVRRESLSVNNRRGSKSSMYKNRPSRQNSVSSIGSDFASADERPQGGINGPHSPRKSSLHYSSPNPTDETSVDQHRVSLAGSTTSTYRDAQEEANTNDVD